MKNIMRIISLALVCLLVAGALTACASKDKLEIPDAYKNAVTVNLFEDTWSVQEDGSDKTGSVDFAKGSDEYNEILGYIDGLALTKVANSGNYTADFSFSADGNGYDFVFTGDGELILRDPEGSCKKVGLQGNRYDDLKEYIGEIRLGEALKNDDDGGGPIAGGYSEDRDVTEEDMAVFNEALEGYAGMAFTPIKVAMQVVAGMNYRFTCKAKAVVPDAEETTKLVSIFKPLEGPAELVGIVDLED